MLLGALFLNSLLAPPADALQASASILLVPSKQETIVSNEEVTVQVYILNGSTAAGATVPARIHGPIAFDLSDTSCGGPDNHHALTFVPGAAMGCDAKDPAVAGCAQGRLGEVLINLDQDGMTLPVNDVPAFVATIRLKNRAEFPNQLPRIDIRATTSPRAVEACEPIGTNVNCAYASTEGIIFLSGNAPAVLGPPCRGCKATISFGSPTGPSPDTLQVHVLPIFLSSVDPAREAIRINLRGSVTVFDLSLPPGILTKIRGGAYRLQRPGLDLELTPRLNGQYLVDLHAMGDFRAAERRMTLDFSIGDDSGPLFENWKPKPGGGWIAQP